MVWRHLWLVEVCACCWCFVNKSQLLIHIILAYGGYRMRWVRFSCIISIKCLPSQWKCPNHVSPTNMEVIPPAFRRLWPMAFFQFLFFLVWHESNFHKNKMVCPCTHTHFTTFYVLCLHKKAICFAKFPVHSPNLTMNKFVGGDNWTHWIFQRTVNLWFAYTKHTIIRTILIESTCLV